MASQADRREATRTRPITAACALLDNRLHHFATVFARTTVVDVAQVRFQIAQKPQPPNQRPGLSRSDRRDVDEFDAIGVEGGA